MCVFVWGRDARVTVVLMCCDFNIFKQKSKIKIFSTHSFKLMNVKR